MLDISTPQWLADLRPGAIVSFRFPVEKPDYPGQQPKRRPCLVLEARFLRVTCSPEMSSS
jgi:hypothetical protein